MKCEACKQNAATQQHHRFSQTKWAKRLYGKLIHDPANIQHVCEDCHVSHASPNLTHWDERQFCLALGIEPRSKVMRGRL